MTGDFFRTVLFRSLKNCIAYTSTIINLFLFEASKQEEEENSYGMKERIIQQDEIVDNTDCGKRQCRTKVEAKGIS